MPKKDLQLTAITCILMASKLLETVSLKLDFCMDVLGHKKYTHEEILLKENSVIELCRWQLNKPTQYDVYQLVLMMLNQRIQSSPQTREILTYITEFETLGLQLMRADQISSNHEVHLSQVVRVAALLQIAIGYTSVIFMNKNHRPLVKEMVSVINVWRTLVEEKFS
jgi:hypothetical protein